MQVALSVGTTACNFLIMGVMCLVALIIAFTEADDYEACMHHYKGIKFSYLTWLKATGLMVVYYLVEIALMVAQIMSDTGRRKECILGLQICLLVLFSCFMTAWIVVGGVLLFEEVLPGCSQDSTQWQFGLALFILQILGNSFNFITKCAALIFNFE